MHPNNPHRNLIQSWHWGLNRNEIYVDPKKAPRWVLNRGLLSSPCDAAGCKRFIDKGEWYVRHATGPLGIVCRDCAASFGAVREDKP